MTKKERIQAAIRGEKPDKMPYSFWTHMPGTDLDPEAISQKTYEFYKKYDFDFVKTMNNGMYAIEDFGCTVDYSEIVKGGVAKVVSTPISCAADWRKLTVCPCTQGSNARELRHLQLVLEKLKGEEVPVIFTAFTPITIADKISGGKLISYIEEGHGDDVKAALEVITETTAQLVAAAIDMGADGIFLASQMSSYDKCTDRQIRPQFLQQIRALPGILPAKLRNVPLDSGRLAFALTQKALPPLFRYQTLQGTALLR